MKERYLWGCLSVLSIIVGALLYAVFRPATYIGQVLLSAIPPLSCAIADSPPVFWAYYFPDCLWSFSLTCALFTIVLPKGNLSVILVGTAASLYGLLWETGQSFGVLSGTADVLDISLYIAAASTAVGINILLKRRRKPS